MSVRIVDVSPEFNRYGVDLEAELTELANDPALPGYPEMSNRWHISTDEWDEMAKRGVVTIPDGPWHMTEHPEREAARKRDKTIPDERSVDPQQTARWREQGLLVSDKGFPIHPLGRLGLTSEINGIPIGMATGLGRLWQPGPAISGNLIVERENHAGELEYAMVVTRRTNKQGTTERLSFPGGFGKPGEASIQTAIREAEEEAGLDVIKEITGKSLGAFACNVVQRLNPSLGGPMTLNAWFEEHFGVVKLPNLPEIKRLELQTSDEDEVDSVRWVSAEELTDAKQLMGAHRRAFKAYKDNRHGYWS